MKFYKWDKEKLRELDKPKFEGETKVIHRFLWWPYTLPDPTDSRLLETRWLEQGYFRLTAKQHLGTAYLTGVGPVNFPDYLDWEESWSDEAEYWGQKPSRPEPPSQSPEFPLP